MNPEITLERRGDAIHLVYRHFRGSFPGTLLGNRLGLAGVEDRGPGGHDDQAPSSDALAEEDLKPGQYCLVHPESDDGEMHALLPASQLGDVQRAVIHDLHIPVAAGAELFPPDVQPAELEDARRPRWSWKFFWGGLAILAVLPLQLLAYYIARLNDLNVDQPRNLAKTVTVE